MKTFRDKVAVITGAASGFGLAFACEAARRGMKLVLADIDQEALATAAESLRAGGAQLVTQRVDVACAADVEQLGETTLEAFGAVHLVFNNAGVGSMGPVWESTVKDWEWILGVNLWGVIHGVRVFTPLLMAHGEEAHLINTASVAGLVCPPGMGAYNVSKHAVVALSESLYHDLRVAHSPVGVSVLCPAFVPTGIHLSERNRPQALAEEKARTPAQVAAQAALEKAVSSGRLKAADIAAMTYQAIEERRFYILTHPKMRDSIGLRLADIAELRNPSDPMQGRPTR